MFGIAWGIVSITLMVGAAKACASAEANSESFGKDMMIFFAGRTSMQAGGCGPGATFIGRRRPRQRAAESPACRYVLPEIGNEVPLRSRYNSA